MEQDLKDVKQLLEKQTILFQEDVIHRLRKENQLLTEKLKHLEELLKSLPLQVVSDDNSKRT